MSNPTYAFDPSGTLAANLIPNENHSVSPAGNKNLSYIVPRAAPFFRSSVQLVRMNGTTEVPMTEGIDYVFCFRYTEASIQTSQDIYGGIAFLNRTFSGTVRLKQYRTIGGDWVLDDHTALEVLTDTVYSVRTVMWDQLVQYPVSFPPYNHDHSADDSTGYADLLDKLDDLISTVSTGNSQSAAALIALHTGSSNAHTKAQVGLGNVNNYGTATGPQTVAGTRDDLYTTPAGVKAALDAAGVASGNKTLTLEGDVAASTTIPLGGTWPSVTVALADAFKMIDTRTYPISTARGPDPDTSSLPVFITNHANSPAGAGVLADNVTRPQFFIFNIRHKTNSGDSNLYARSQLAIEHRATKVDGAQRVFVRFKELNSPYAWSAWSLISGNDLNTSYGRTATDPDTVRTPVVRLTMAVSANALPPGEWLLFSYFEVAAGQPITASTPRVQTAIAFGSGIRAMTFTRYCVSEVAPGRWVNTSGNAVIRTTGTIGAVFDEGEYDQLDTDGLDLTTMGYPADVPGRLVVQRKGGGDATAAVANGITQTYYSFSDLSAWVRRYGASAWDAWVQVRSANGGVPASALTTVPSQIGGGATVASDAVRNALGCGTIAEWNIIISDTPPVDPPAKTLWFSSEA